MLKAALGNALFRSMDLPAQKRFASVALQNIIAGATEKDLGLLEELFASLDGLQVLLEDRIRQIKLSGRTLPEAPMAGGRAPLRTWIMEDKAPWKDRLAQPLAMPGMISDEETQYYEYIGAVYEGRGEAIELGPWLGKSTRHIMRGLDQNPKFAGKKLHVFDDFIWRSSWMDPYVSEQDKVTNHADFRPIFEKYTQELHSRLSVSRARISDYDGNEAVPRIHWNGDPIELMYIDCGRTVQANEGWWKIFSPCFIPDVSLLIKQDWRLHRELPRLAYTQTHSFTATHPELDLVHEVQDGGIATFLYRGRR